jgi:hypothetical protein
MSWKISLIFSLSALSVALSAPPVFLAGSGTKICTLDKVGKIPVSPGGTVVRPVYQKVCRAVIPTLMADEDDDEENDEPNALSDEIAADEPDDEQVEQVRRAILASGGIK